MNDMPHLTQEDVPNVPMPKLVELLADLQYENRSIHWDRVNDVLNVAPSPEGDTVKLIQVFYEQLRDLLPGFCEHCMCWVIKRTEVFWGAHPHLCRRCLDREIEKYANLGKWPKPNGIDQL
jgi:hypothetical protein